MLMLSRSTQLQASERFAGTSLSCTLHIPDGVPGRRADRNIADEAFATTVLSANKIVHYKRSGSQVLKAVATGLNLQKYGPQNHQIEASAIRACSVFRTKRT